MANKERKDNSFIKKPIYPGGTSAYRKFIKENMQYPKAALKNKTEGIVYLKYSINHKGDVIDTKVLKGIGDGCDEEAQRILKLLKFEIPKGPRKLRVLFHQKTQITFRLPKVKKSIATPSSKPTAKPLSNPAATRLVYNYQPASKKKAPPKKNKGGYTITITRK